MRNGEISQKKAAKKFGIPVMTLSDHVNGRVSGTKPGVRPVMSVEMERQFSSLLIDVADKGFGLPKQLVMRKAADFCRAAKIDHPFKEGPAGESWYRGFMDRHPELSHRTPSKVCTNRGKAMRRDVVASYFKDLGAITAGIPPEQIWNMDESGFHFEHNPIKVVCKKGTKALNSRVSSSRENVTIIGCASGAGAVLPPMFIVKGKTFKSLNSFNTADSPPHSVWTWQAKAWMEDSLGVEWLKKIFLPYCGPQRPQVLVLDQHHSHEAYSMLKLAKEQDIHILALPPHTSHWLQPLDKGCFSALSRYYRSICSQFMSSSRSHVVNKATFTRLFSQAWERGMTQTNVRSGFRVTGIVPFNPEAIPETAYTSINTSTPTTTPISQLLGSTTSTITQLPASITTTTITQQPISTTTTTITQDPMPASATSSVPPAATSNTSLQSAIIDDTDIMEDPALAATLELLSDAAENFEVDAETITAASASSASPTEPETSPEVMELEVASAPPQGAFWSQTMTDLFGVMSDANILPNSSGKKKKAPIVVHRVLTSDEILRQKKKEVEEKAREKGEKAKAREESRKKRAQVADEKRRAREARAAGKKNGKPAATRKTVSVTVAPKTQDKCILCLTEDRGGWVRCDRCMRWMHQACVPTAYKSNMDEAIEGKTDFLCHLCLFLIIVMRFCSC